MTNVSTQNYSSAKSPISYGLNPDHNPLSNEVNKSICNNAFNSKALTQNQIMDELTKSNGGGDFSITTPEKTVFYILKNDPVRQFNTDTLAATSDAEKLSMVLANTNEGIKDKTYFFGESKPVEVLINFSKMAMGLGGLREESLSKQRFKEVKTPEVQASIVGDQIVFGTNGDDSALPAMLKEFFSTPGDRSHYISKLEGKYNQLAGNIENIKTRVSEGDPLVGSQELSNAEYDCSKIKEQLDAAKWMSSFVDDDSKFDDLKCTTAREMVAANADEDFINRRLTTLDALRNALKSTNFLEAPPLDQYNSGYFKKDKDGFVIDKHPMHAEQRIVEHIQTNASIGSKYFDKIKSMYGDGKGEIFLGGTKAPCGRCYSTENARREAALQQTGGSASDLVSVVRYEDAGHPFGVIGAKPVYNTVDPKVQKIAEANVASMSEKYKSYPTVPMHMRFSNVATNGNPTEMHQAEK